MAEPCGGAHRLDRFADESHRRIYSPEGVYDRVVRFGRNPDVVLVDSAVIVQAPVRFLDAGMGDALSTFYEARSSRKSRRATISATASRASRPH